MPSYVKRYWDESRGDEFDAWGNSMWFFEVGTDGSALRQVEKYDSGMVLRYGSEHMEDIYGSLTDKPVDIHDPQFQIITAAEFELTWQPSEPHGDKPKS